MPRERLGQLLEQLQRELQEPDALGAEGRAGLENLRDEIRVRLTRDSDAALVDLSLIARLEQAIREFENEHPDFTIQLKAVVDAFRALGFR